ncbi:helix-turn-helix domain-containing protein [Rhodoligotrophos defluvii]|uniref:helix-turn-helix domain-containing protein n=1 Tax=Rhodoligotrophos defluvii TaxID=2561934 RepID=UPI0010C9D727|nr:helix-turn-helix transcriptional regulator [Rhodoligotrophos defluvii]
MLYGFPAILTPEEETIIVRFRDLPEAITEGATRAEAMAAAVDCLDVALLFRAREEEPIPEPSPKARGEVVVAPSPAVAAKLILRQAFVESGLSQSELARRIGVGETEVRRMLDPDHATKIDRLDRALRVLGRRLVVDVQAA